MTRTWTDRTRRRPCQGETRSQRRWLQWCAPWCLLGLLLAGCSPDGGHTGASGDLQEAGDPGQEFLAPSPIEGLLPPARDLNVLIVSFDALRADHLGTYGWEGPVSPRIDAFADTSLVFESAYAAAPVTPTSFAAAFSGLWPFRIFRGWTFTAEDTLAGSFSAAGFLTAAILNNVQLVRERGFGRGFDLYRVQPEQNKSDEEILAETLDWLRGRQESRFFLWVHFLNPHAPYERREIAENLYSPGYSGEYLETTGGRFETDDPADIERIHELYVGEVRYIDDLFGRFLDGLDALGLLDTTVVVLTSDHGEEFMERGVFQHHHLSQETLHVPLIIHHPRGAPARIDLPVSHVDLYPTLAGLIGQPLPGELDGIDLGQPLPQVRSLVSVAMTAGDYQAVSLVYDGYKLILSCRPETAVELYDLRQDPGEQEDLSRSHRREAAEQARRLQREIGADPCTTLDRAVAGKSPIAGLRHRTIEALRSLGYLDD